MPCLFALYLGMMININSDAVVVFTNKLEKMSRSALPYAIRQTLNTVAFDVKKNTMPKSADNEFENRSPNFFKANSRVDMATGNDIDSMKSTVGFIGNDQAVRDLEQQEYGGTIEARSFIPMDTARVGSSNSKKIRPANRISKVNKIIDSNTMEGKTPQQKFNHAVAKAGSGGYVIGNNENKTLFRVESIDSSGYKLRALFSYKKGRTVKVSETSFMRDASIESADKMEKIFIDQATKQIERIR
jgi:hypothetical protein